MTCLFKVVYNFRKVFLKSDSPLHWKIKLIFLKLKIKTVSEWSKVKPFIFFQALFYFIF